MTATTTTPSWYDLLDVDPSASAEKVRAAWKQAIADLEPGDRRFQVLNQAAEVLLDPDRRAAYDAEVFAAELDAHVEDAASQEQPAPVVSPAGRVPWVVPGWLLVVLGVVATLVVGGCTVLAVTQPSDASVAGATRDAQASAERAIVPVLSYDAADMAGSQQAAEGYLTADYRKKYDQLFAEIGRAHV